MKRLSAILVLSLLALTASAQSYKTLFDFDWKFTEGDVKGAQSPSFDAASWAGVDLPHDWDIHHAPTPMDIKLSGAGSLLAAVSADMKDCEAYTSAHVTTWCGRAMLVVRSSRKAGSIKLETSSALKDAKMTLKTR